MELNVSIANLLYFSQYMNMKAQDQRLWTKANDPYEIKILSEPAVNIPTLQYG